MLSRTSARHKAVLNVKQYLARGSTRCSVARLEAMLAARWLLGWSGARCEVAQLVAFLIVGMHSMSSCAHCELTLDMTRVHLFGFAYWVYGSGPQVGSLSWGHT